MISRLADLFYKFIALKDILHVCIFCQYLFVLISDILSPEFLCVIRQISFAADYAAICGKSYILNKPLCYYLREQKIVYFY